MLSDNISLVLALGKGRSSSRHLIRCCRSLFAIGVACDMSFTVRWIASELNPADAPSRFVANAATVAAGSSMEALDRRKGRWINDQDTIKASLGAAIDSMADGIIKSGQPFQASADDSTQFSE